MPIATSMQRFGMRKQNQNSCCWRSYSTKPSPPESAMCTSQRCYSFVDSTRFNKLISPLKTNSMRFSRRHRSSSRKIHSQQIRGARHRRLASTSSTGDTGCPAADATRRSGVPMRVLMSEVPTSAPNAKKSGSADHGTRYVRPLTRCSPSVVCATH